MKSDIEVTMNVTKDGLTIRNFHSMDGISMFNMSDQKGGKKVKTETTITADKLTRHKIQIPVEFSFSFKEFMVRFNYYSTVWNVIVAGDCHIR